MIGERLLLGVRVVETARKLSFDPDRWVQDMNRESLGRGGLDDGGRSTFHLLWEGSWQTVGGLKDSPYGWMI